MSASPRSETMQILYVEDNDDLRETICILLEADDRVILPVATAEQALAAFERQRFDLVITDISLPGMSGTDLARQLLTRHPEHWIVLCSGYELRHGLATLGPNVRSLLKPFEPEELDLLMREIQAEIRA